MQKIFRLFVSLHNDESGQDLIEYALIAALLALAAVVTMSTLGSSINQAFSTISSTVSGSLSS